MVLARVRVSNETGKAIVNRQFADLATAQAWCTRTIGLSTVQGFVEYIGLTDYETMHEEEFEV